MIDFRAEQKRIDDLRSELERVEKNLLEEEDRVDEAEKNLVRTQKAQEIIQLVAQAVQQKVHERIAGVVSSCLSSVFPDPYEFKILFERKRGKTEACIQFCRRGLVVDPLTASGGGVIDVTAFALRAACLMLHRPRLTRLVVLDEPFRFVSEDFQENIRSMIEQLSSDLKIQILLVTHNETLATGKIVRL